MKWDQRSFDDWADVTSTRSLVLLGVVLLVMAMGCLVAYSAMGPRLVREGSLLWFGTRTDGVVESTKVEEVGKFKGGAPKYRLTINYRFTTGDGVEYRGTTDRSDVRTPPDFVSGDPVGVYFDPAKPANSVAEHNLQIDVYALVLFLPFLSVMGLAVPAGYFYRMWNWRRRVAS